MEHYQQILDRYISLKDQEGTSKVCELKDAVSRLVEPGMMIHFGQASVRWATATIYEIARQFWGTSPEFTLVGLGMNHPSAALVHGGLVTKLIISYCGDSYLTPGPNAAFQRAFRDGTVEFENWSILTLALRLKAAAEGLSFAPTRSLSGSSMAADNSHAYLEIDDPFNPGQKIGLVKALTPDLTIVHGAVADRHGNTIFLPPNVENAYGAMASKQGALVTVEKIVSTDYIRRHSHLVKLPGQFVSALVEVPYGGHPSKHPQQGLEGFQGYGEDYSFIVEAKDAAKSPETLQQWIDKWVLSCRDHEEYLRNVGHKKLMELKGKILPDSWKLEFRDLQGKLSDRPECTPVEMAIVVASRMLKEKVLASGCSNILCGAGMANLAGWLAYYRLRDQGVDLDIMAEAGMFGYSPRPGDPTTFNTRNFPSCKMLTDVHQVMGIFAGGARNRCLGSLGAGQIDRQGNINSTMIPEKGVFMVGSGGANDITSSAKEVVAIAMQHPNSFVERVPYVTSPGPKVRTVVSHLGVFKKPNGGDDLELSGVFPGLGLKDMDEAVRNIQERCGWKIKVAGDIDWVEPPNIQELQLLRIFDPNRLFLGKVK